MAGLEALVEFPHQVIGSVSCLSLVGFPVKLEAQKHVGTGQGATDASRPHAGAEGAPHAESRFPVKAVVLAESDEQGLGSAKALAEELESLFDSAHGTSLLASPSLGRLHRRDPGAGDVFLQPGAWKPLPDLLSAPSVEVDGGSTVSDLGEYCSQIICQKGPGNT